MDESNDMLVKIYNHFAIILLAVNGILRQQRGNYGYNHSILFFINHERGLDANSHPPGHSRSDHGLDRTESSTKSSCTRIIPRPCQMITKGIKLSEDPEEGMNERINGENRNS